VEYFGSYKFKNEAYIVLELLNCSLSQFLQQNKNLLVGTLIRLIHQISSCLSYLEEKEIIHGNICCDNILKKGSNQLKFCDFKFGHTLSKPLILSEDDISHIQFCAPEVKENKRFDKKSDVWGWAVTCIQIFYLNNGQPFQINENTLLTSPPECPEELWPLITKALNPNPTLRPTFKEIESECPKVFKLFRARLSLVRMQTMNEEDPYFTEEGKLYQN